MNISKCGFRCLATVGLVTFYLLANTTIAKADSILKISVEATFAQGTANQVNDPTPDFYLTGNFTLDRGGPSPVGTVTGTITSFSMVLTPVGSSPYTFSSGTGSGQAYCSNFSCSGFGYWSFYFSNANASIGLPTIYYDLPLALGGTYYLGAGFTTYPDGRTILPWGDASACASFGGETGCTYGEDLGSVLTSGYIHVDAVPEPPPFILLLVGVGLLLGVRRWSAQRV